MSGKSSADRAEMAKAAGQINDALGTISNIQRQLGSNVQGLMATWQGNAATAFLKAFTEFDQQFSVVLNELDGIHGKLTDTQSRLTHIEQEQVAAANPIVGLLNN